MAEIPPANSTDSEDVVWGLQTADTLWKRGERIDALVWLRRAAQAAGDSNNDDRALELARYAAELTEFMAADEASMQYAVTPAAPYATDATDAPPPLHAPGAAYSPEASHGTEASYATDATMEVDEAELGDSDLLEDDLVEEAVEAGAPSVTIEVTSDDDARPSVASVPPAAVAHAGMFDPWAETPASTPTSSDTRAPRDRESSEEVVTSVRPNALLAQPLVADPPPSSRSLSVSSPPPSVAPPPRPSRPSTQVKAAPPAISTQALAARPTSGPRPPPPLPPRARPPLPRPPAMNAHSPGTEPPPAAAPFVPGTEPPPPAPFVPGTEPPPAPAPFVPGTEPPPAPAPFVPGTEPPPPPAPAPFVPGTEPPPPVEVPSPRPASEPPPPPVEVPSPRPASEPPPPPVEVPPPSPGPAPETVTAAAPAPPGLDLESVDAFSDLPDDARAAFAAAATLHDLAEGDEIATFALAYVVSGAFDVAATMVDAPAVRILEGAVLRSRGSTEEGVPMRLISAKGHGIVATWSDEAVEEAFRTCPWVEQDLRVLADRVQILVGITIGPLGERLDMSLREQIVGRLAMRPLGPNEVVVSAGETVPGLLLVGIGELELVDETGVKGIVSSGEFLFPTEVLGMGDAPLTARAGKGGALVMFGDRGLAQELLVTCPPLLEVFAGM